MYSTNIKNSRCNVECLAVFRKVFMERFVVDTGAKFTCCSYKVVDGQLKEEQLGNCEQKHIGGLVEGQFLKFYRLPLQQFMVGNIDMGQQHIWITFDEKITDIILGMDILQQIIFIANPYNKRIYFCKDSEDYNNNFQLLTA